MFLQGPRNYDKDSSKPTVFKIKIHDPFSIADIRTSVNVKAGYETTFVITPSQIVASQDVKYMAPDRRNCLFNDETGKLLLFKYLVKIIMHLFHADFHEPNQTSLQKLHSK